METPGSAEIFLFEGFHLDRRGLFRRDENAALVPVETGSRALDILGVLLQKPGDLVSRDEIMAAAWPETVVEDHNLTVQVSALRRVLDKDREQGSCIQTVPGRGYRFVAPVTRVQSRGPQVAELFFRDGSDRPTAENGQSGDPVAPIGIFNFNLAPASTRARHRLRRVMVAVIGALGLVLAAAVGIRYSPWSAGLPSAPRLSIVVLPFANFSGDLKQQYFADAITDDVTTDLSRLRDMLVISRNSAFTYKDKPVNTKQIGRELGVRYVLEGSVRRSDNQVRVTVQLIDAATDTHLWAERFDRDTGNLFALQDEITSWVANALGVELIGREAARPTENPDALDYVLRGRAAETKPTTRENFAQTVSLFERALAVDPESLEARSQLAAALATRSVLGLTASRAADIARADALAGQVVAVSPRDGVAHFARGQLLRASGRCAEAIPEYEAALASNHNWAVPLNGLSLCKLLTGSIEEAIPLVERAIRLSPRDPAIGFWYGTIGWVHLLQSHIDEATVWFEKLRTFQPKLPHPHALLASAYGLKGDTERAAAELAEAKRLIGDDRYTSIARLRAFGFSGPAGWGVPKVQALFEATYFAGLRKAGMAEQ